MLIGVDRDDIKSAHAVGELFPFCEKNGSSSDQLALLVNVNRESGARKIVGRAITHFDKYKTIPVQHNQVDFTKTGVEVLTDQGQALAQQILVGLVLGVCAYNSRGSSSHDSSSAASGNNNSGSSLRS